MTMDAIFQTMQGLISEQFGLAPEKISMETSFETDLGADSVDLVELVMTMEGEFDVGEIGEEDLSALKTVGDCVNYLSAKLK